MIYCSLIVISILKRELIVHTVDTKMEKSIEMQWCIFIPHCSFLHTHTHSLSELYYSKLCVRLRNKNIRRGGFASMLKKRSSRRLVIPFGIKVNGYLQLKFLRLHKSTADKFELYHSRRKESSHLLPSYFLTFSVIVKNICSISDKG